MALTTTSSCIQSRTTYPHGWAPVKSIRNGRPGGGAGTVVASGTAVPGSTGVTAHGFDPRTSIDHEREFRSLAVSLPSRP